MRFGINVEEASDQSFYVRIDRGQFPVEGMDQHRTRGVLSHAVKIEESGTRPRNPTEVTHQQLPRAPSDVLGALGKSEWRD
jgi:hypothetical protein